MGDLVTLVSSSAGDSILYTVPADACDRGVESHFLSRQACLLFPFPPNLVIFLQCLHTPQSILVQWSHRPHLLLLFLPPISSPTSSSAFSASTASKVPLTSLAEVPIRIGPAGGPGSTREEGGLLELNVTNVLELGSQDVLEVPADVGEEAVGSEMEDLVSSFAGDVILCVPADACDSWMGFTSQSRVPEVLIRVETERSTRDGGGLLELNATNLLALGPQEVIEVTAAGEEAVGEESD